ncbi:methyltransferase domain-containing protein [Streptomyces pseudovenezuelae]|uniref:methyltransferase domain-containing protein n=1 Tax=Streptomyces pseudovenezuelae TaxID=67350 RepID=UPI0036E4D2BA
MPEFVAEYPLARLKPAPYNPRRLSDDAFGRLKQSLDLFGCVKPVIVNGNGILVAGHQRTKSLKALDVTMVPAILLGAHVTTQDEVQFNLLHNSVETDGSRVTVTVADESAHGWEWLTPDEITVQARDSAAVRSEISRLITRYGPWGSIVADHAGRVILNNDYAVSAVDLRKDVLCYRVSVQEADELLVWLEGEYGVYDYTQLGIKPYNQHWCQMHRLGGDDGDSAKSAVYVKHVLPTLKKSQRIVDFGAGEAAYITLLKEQGYDAHWYEPHVKAKGTQNALDVAATVAHIRDLHRDVRANGQYDIVVLDSVINSITSLEFEEHVLITCNTLCADDGVFFTGTRHMKSISKRNSGRKYRNNRYRRALEFVDENGFSATFRAGVWTMQRFHTRESLTALLRRYFGEVRIGVDTGGSLTVECRRPLPVSPERRRAALEAEFNMEYPGEYRHNRHKPLVEALIQACAGRDQKVTNPA